MASEYSAERRRKILAKKKRSDAIALALVLGTLVLAVVVLGAKLLL
jgi:hypothetical protein